MLHSALLRPASSYLASSYLASWHSHRAASVIWATLLTMLLAPAAFAQTDNGPAGDPSAPTERASNPQPGSDSPADSAPAEGTTAGGAPARATNAESGFQAPFSIELDEEAATPSIMERVDSAFATSVKYMELVLFYRLGRQQRSFIQFDQHEYYVRKRGSEGDFVLLDQQGQPTETKLSPREVERRTILDMLSTDKKGNAIRDGRLDNDLVEMVVVDINSSKYVLSDGVYKKMLPTRELLDDNDVLSPEQAEKAAKQGELKLSEDTDAATPYVLSEYTGGIPLVVVWLAIGAVIFTFSMGFYNIFAFRHAIDIVRGKYDNPNETGEVTHFQALASALSATVGLGNIAGVTIAMTLGGPGAFFWMLLCGLFGMSSKFVECTLGQKYRQVKPDGTVLGGPMQYLHAGLKELGLGPLGLVLSIIFAVMCILASFGGGNMFQANQSAEQLLAMMQRGSYRQLDEVETQIREAADAGDLAQMQTLQVARTGLTAQMSQFARYFKPAYGLVLAFAVAIVIIGGIKRIGAAAEKVVPSMCAIYIAACLWIIGAHIQAVPALVGQIISEAFSPGAFGGGMLGVLAIGVQRAAFSNEAGVGSAAIAHSAAKTEEPVREGTVALLGPFIDTVVICSMTALVILITGAWDNKSWVVDQGLQGATLTSRAFETEISWFPYVLTLAVVLFAYSTLISWSYYGERCWERLFGARSTIVYKFIYVSAAFVGAIVNLGSVLDFSDMMILSMAFPNVFGLLLLSPKVRRDMLSYWKRYKANEFKTFKK